MFRKDVYFLIIQQTLGKLIDHMTKNWTLLIKKKKELDFKYMIKKQHKYEQHTEVKKPTEKIC
jgi:hypothetical protein